MRKIIILITSSFPYGKGETFLEEEISYMKCDKLIIIPLSACGELRVLSAKINYEVLPLLHNNKKELSIECVKSLFNSFFWVDILRMKRMNKLTFQTVKKSLSFLSHAVAYAKKAIKKLTSKLQQSDQLCFYSYWMLLPALVAIILKKKFTGIAITRCHGGDLYEYRDPSNILPLREYILKNIDRVYCISKDGIDYLSMNYPKYSEKYELSRLGISGTVLNYTNFPREGNTFKIISCSWITPIKRIERIVSILSLVQHDQIEWTHFGGGEQLEQVKKNAHEKLDGKIKWKIMGELQHDKILREYENNKYHLFINVSSTEGIPVSIMEAFSFSIPVIATDVGGVSEIVENGVNGFLINRDFNDTEVAELIKYVINMSDAAYLNMRASAKQKWERYFVASLNYTDFYNKLSVLLKERRY